MEAPDHMNSHSRPLECPSCGSRSIRTSFEMDEFQYGSEAESVKLSISVPVHACSNCDLSYVGEEASDLKHAAICRHLEVFSPDEVRGIRERYKLSQAEFSDLTKIGKASIARWESGALIQNQSVDKYLFLLTFEDNVKRLGGRGLSPIDIESQVKQKQKPPFPSRFREIAAGEIDALKHAGLGFSLHPSLSFQVE